MTPRQSIIVGRVVETSLGDYGGIKVTVDRKGPEKVLRSIETQLNADMNLPEECHTA
ncbi:MAG: hypothetical protein KIS29_05330 [Thermoplasmata archaeon]|nr:hypothetical protein [Candidatus Sysuiplasma jiujiangense]